MIALSFLLLFSCILVFEVKLPDVAATTPTSSTLSDTNNFKPSLWYSPDGSLPKNYDAREDSTDIVSVTNAQISVPLPPAESKNKIWLIVNQNIYPTIKNSLT